MVARYLPASQDSDADLIPDWYEIRGLGDLSGAPSSNPDGDALTYSWEQYNASNTATPVNVDNGKNAVIRALPPTQTNLRAIPTLPALYSAQSFPGDMLLQKSRKDMHCLFCIFFEFLPENC